jgi:ornithine decarboxylase
MERFPAASALIGAWKPDRPVIGLRPHAAGRAARWFLRHFPGDVAYAYKANSSVFLLGALYGAGIRKFDVASIPEIEDAATIPGAELHFMHPVKSRIAIRRAFAEFGVRSFALDSEDELRKITEETGGCRDLTLWVRLAVPSLNSKIPLERKYGVAGVKATRLLAKVRQAARELGVTFHVGSQTATPEAYLAALTEVGKLIARADVVLDRLDVGGGFPSIYEEDGAPAPLSAFVHAIMDGVDRLPIANRCRVMCEPGRALVAEAESLIVRVDARRGNELFINDGGYGTLFDATHMGFNFPVRLIGQEPEPDEPMTAFSFWGPTCDTVDFMKGPFVLPTKIKEGDYIEIGNTGAYGRAIAGRFNGYGAFDEAILLDEPMLTMYPTETEHERRERREVRQEAQQVQA